MLSQRIVSRRSTLLGYTCLVHDLSLTVVSLLLAYQLRNSELPTLLAGRVTLPPMYPLRDYWPLLLGILLVWPVVGFGLGIYHEVEMRGRQQMARDVIRLVAVGLIAVYAGLYLSKAEYISRTFVLVFGAANAMTLVAGRWLWFSTGAWLRETLQRYHYFLIVGTGPEAQELAQLIEEDESQGLRLVGFVSPSAAGATDALPAGLRKSYPVLAADDVPGVFHRQVVDEVLFAIGEQQMTELAPLVLRCEEEGVKMRFRLEFLPPNAARIFRENLRHIPLLSVANAPVDELHLWAKRGADVVVSLFTLFVLSPVMALLALLIRLTSPGPVLYRQTRCGLGGRAFTLYKFRSMVKNAEALRVEFEHMNERDGPDFKIADDPRCTPLGRWLRKFYLDELPQFWNVLRGDMSLVGPRPPLPAEVEKYERWQRRRLRMRPGLTCLGALEGRSRLTFDRWVRLDLAYIDNWSLWLDLKIFLRTIPIVVFGRGTS